MNKIILGISALLICVSAQAQQMGLISVSVANLREEPAYEAEMGTQAMMGTIVEITDKEGYWLRVHTPDGYKAWVNELAVTEIGPNELEAYKNRGKYICTCRNALIYSAPNLKSPIISNITKGNILVHGKLDRKKGFVSIETPDGRQGWVRSADVMDHKRWTESRVCSGENVVSEALQYLGVPYLWGGMSVNGFDCSGLTSFAYAMCGKPMPRNASWQAKEGKLVIEGELKREDEKLLQKGDLIFFGKNGRVSHVGIYIGEGHMIHASQAVRINSIFKGETDAYENLDRLLFVKRYCN